MHKRFRQVFTSLKEHSCVSYARIATIGGFCDVDLIIVKATAPDDIPLPEKYVYELLKIFSISPSTCRTFTLSFTRRFGRTRCWRVALKSLLLLHRLLRSMPENSPFRSELIRARSNGLISLYPCHFHDESSTFSEDYTNFIRTYAQLLDEALDCSFSLDSKVAYEEEECGILEDKKMEQVEKMIEVLPKIQSLVDRVMDCRPIGYAARSFIIQSAMKYIIRDSFICYTTFRKELAMVLDNLFQMQYLNCVTAFGIYKKAAVQANQLGEFYDWSKSMGLCGWYEYPFIDRIPQIQIQALETFLNGMWVLETQSADNAAVSSQWEKFEEKSIFPRKLEGNEEMPPLIQFEDSENGSWEDILEASVNLPNNFSHNNSYGYDQNIMKYGLEDENNAWKIQVYNPFFQPPNMPNYYSCGL